MEFSKKSAAKLACVISLFCAAPPLAKSQAASLTAEKCDSIRVNVNQGFHPRPVAGGNSSLALEAKMKCLEVVDAHRRLLLEYVASQRYGAVHVAKTQVKAGAAPVVKHEQAAVVDEEAARAQVEALKRLNRNIADLEAKTASLGNFGNTLGGRGGAEQQRKEVAVLIAKITGESYADLRKAKEAAEKMKANVGALGAMSAANQGAAGAQGDLPVDGGEEPAHIDAL